MLCYTTPHGEEVPHHHEVDLAGEAPAEGHRVAAYIYIYIHIHTYTYII